MGKIDWNENGWNVIQEADPVKHILEITCLAEDGKVVEVRKRHNDGEEERLTKKLDDTYTLPMSLGEFKKALSKKQIKFK